MTESRILSIYPFFLILGAVLLVSGCMNKVIAKSKCPAGHIESVTSCEGASDYAVAKGVPGPVYCDGFLQNIDNLISREGRNCRVWQPTDCSPYDGMDKWLCFDCSRISTRENKQYSFFASFSSKCDDAVFFAGINRTPAEFKHIISNTGGRNFK